MMYGAPCLYDSAMNMRSIALNPSYTLAQVKARLDEVEAELKLAAGDAAGAYAEPDSVAIESQGKDFTFPHVLESDRRTGTYNFTVRATDANSCQGTRAVSITLTCPNITIAPVTIPNATQFVSYTQTLTATGGNSPYTWTVLTGSLPNGMSLSSGGVLSGIPTSAPGNFTFDRDPAPGDENRVCLPHPELDRKSVV